VLLVLPLLPAPHLVMCYVSYQVCILLGKQQHPLLLGCVHPPRLPELCQDVLPPLLVA
jgi:hypothetical protein